MAVEVPVEKGPVTSQDFLDAFNDDKPSKDDKKEVDLKLDDSEDESEDELPPLRGKSKVEDEEKEEVEKPAEEDEEKEELNLEDEDEIDLAGLPTRAKIKEMYPDIFKKIPQLDHVIQREHQFSELFSTLKDAKVAKESLNDYNAFQSELFNGDLKGILRAVKKSDENAYNKLIGNYIEDLARVDPAANLRVANKITKSILKVLDNRAKELGDSEDGEQLGIAIGLVNKALYGSTKLSDPEISQQEAEDPREVRLKEEQSKFEQSKYQAAFTDVSTRMKSLLTKAVTRDIDPRGTIPSYVKEKLVEDVLSDLDNQLMGDSRFKNLVGSLWSSAHKNGYDASSTNKILEALKRKAQTMLPPIMRAKKERALKGLGVSVRRKEVDEVDETPKNSGDKREPREKITSNRQDGKDRLKMRDGESAMDFFARD